MDYRGDFINSYIQRCWITMMSLISLLIILYYACINFHKFGVARESARPTGVDKGGSSDFDKFPLISNYGMQSLKIWFLLIKDK